MTVAIDNVIIVITIITIVVAMVTVMMTMMREKMIEVPDITVGSGIIIAVVEVSTSVKERRLMGNTG